MREREYTLVTGGVGFIGSNLVDTLAAAGEPVVVLDSLTRDGVELNARWLLERHGPRVRIEVGDVRDAGAVAELVRRARRVYHLAAQVAVTTSLEDPREDLNSNLLGTLNVLEAARSRAEPPPVLFTSTNKVYGSLEQLEIRRRGDVYVYGDGRRGIPETTPLDFHSPYACSKGAADQYVRDYARTFGLPTVVFRMSCIYGPRQFGTEDQGWVSHFARALLSEAPLTVYGDGCQVRDVLWVGDLVTAMRLAMERIDTVSGEVLNIGGGPDNAVSIRQVVQQLMHLTGRRVRVSSAPWRAGDQRIYVSEIGRAERILGWTPETSWRTGLRQLVRWLEEADLPVATLPLSLRTSAAFDPAAL